MLRAHVFDLPPIPSCLQVGEKVAVKLVRI
jgi:hypothetical protein